MERGYLACLGAVLGLVVVATLATKVGRRTEPAQPDADASRPGVTTPSTAAEWQAYGDTLRLLRKDLRGAEEAYRRAVELDPKHAEAHFALGSVLLDLRAPVEAAAALESALSLAPPDAIWRKDAEAALARAHLLK